MEDVAISWATQIAKERPGTETLGSALPGPLEWVVVGSKGPAPSPAPHGTPRRRRRLPGGGVPNAEEEPDSGSRDTIHPDRRQNQGGTPSARQKAPGAASWKRNRFCAWG